MRVEAEIHPHREDRIALVSPYTAKDLVLKIPGSSWSKDDSKWSVPLAWTSCLALRDIFGDDLIVGEELTKWAWALKRDVLDPAMVLREAMDIAGGSYDGRLYSYQKAGIEFLALVRKALLLDEMGSGKTVQSVLALQKLRDYGVLAGPVLVVCPNTAKRTWAREIEMWWPGQKVVVVAGTAAQRRKQIESGADWLIINWEGLRAHSRLAPYGSYALRRCAECGGTGTVKVSMCEVHERELNRISFGAVIADEAHRCKDPTTAQTRALRAATGDAPIRFGLTGTPISKDPTELWSLLHWMDPQEWPAKTKWTERLIDFTYNIFGGMEVNGIKPTHDAEFHAGVDPKFRRMTKAVVLPFLPPIVEVRRDVEMNARQAKAYEDMASTMLAKLDAGVLMAANPMVQVGRLMQLASSYGDLEVRVIPVKDEDGEPKVDPVTGKPVVREEEHLRLTEPSSKLDAFMADLYDFGTESVIVFAESRQLIEMLSERMNKNPEIKGGPIRHGLITGAVTAAARDRTIEEFQRGDFQYVLVTVKTGGSSITLTKASIEVFLQRNWSPVEMDQAIARAHRIGSEIHDSINVIDYVTPGSVEEVQLAALDKGRDMLEEIVRDEALLRRFLMGEPIV